MKCSNCGSYDVGQFFEVKMLIENKPNGQVIMQTAKHFYGKCYECGHIKSHELKTDEDELPV